MRDLPGGHGFTDEPHAVRGAVGPEAGADGWCDNAAVGIQMIKSLLR